MVEKLKFDVVRMMAHGTIFVNDLEQLVLDKVFANDFKRNVNKVIQEWNKRTSLVYSKIIKDGDVSKLYPIFDITNELYHNIENFDIAEKQIINKHWTEIKENIDKIISREICNKE